MPRGGVKVVVTGGAGFLGLRLVRRILERGTVIGKSGRKERVREIVIADNHIPIDFPTLGPLVRLERGSVADPEFVGDLITGDDVSIFHLASVVSGEAEQDFDLAMQINLHGHLNVLEAARKLGSCPRYVFASSIAAYGGKSTPKSVSEITRLVPQTTYGASKVIGELLINDYSRKRFIDGRVARLGMVIVRPGEPNRAASSFGSGIIREPLKGHNYSVPVPLNTCIPVIGYQTAVDGLLALHDVDDSRLGDDRIINLPMISVSLDEIVRGLKSVASDRKLGSIVAAPDPFTMEIVAGWPAEVEGQRAKKFGFPRDTNIDDIIQAYIDDYADAPSAVK